ncbi:hemin transporter [Rhodanobacter sp. B04]|uniref:hemin uptake protein HemP n=1 Tax=Rhodanobacter sp. B04 TaxID=1945860 RepID=UPI0009871AC4|nr:hemin uptake protein HemP [Rhodanobacter sp. B04]OOG66151.1 hemin transporter [Rhodanobacter sp. B04]
MSTSVLSLTPSSQALAARRRSAPAPGIAAATRHVTSQSLLAGGRELVIQHQGGEYHLRLTRNDKLILTK